MKKLVIILTILLVLTGCNKTKKEEIKKENLHSNFEFLKLELKDENVIYSPLSLNTAFSMLKEGANGKTKEELDKLFSDIKVNKYETSNELSFANSIFINENHKEEIKKEYVQLLQNKYYSEVLYDTFETPDKINEWIYNKTLGLIEKALNDDQVDQDTMLVLVNALAIDIKWKKEFDENNTYKEIFNSKDESKEYVSMMHNTYSSDALYYKDDNISAVSLDLEPVNNTELEFIAIMPNDIDKYVSELTNETIDELYKKMISPSEDTELRLSFPKLKFEYKLDLVNDLKTLGVNEIFKPSADLSGIGSDLYVSDAIHKANIDLGEKGVKASATTVIIVTKNAISLNENVKIDFNKPFVFIIRDKNTSDIWFVGSILKLKED